MRGAGEVGEGDFPTNGAHLEYEFGKEDNYKRQNRVKMRRSLVLTKRNILILKDRWCSQRQIVFTMSRCVLVKSFPSKTQHQWTYLNYSTY